MRQYSTFASEALRRPRQYHSFAQLITTRYDNVAFQDGLVRPARRLSTTDGLDTGITQFPQCANQYPMAPSQIQ